MIFSKDIEKCCALCTHATIVLHKDQVICPKKGIVNADFCCRKFLYSPLKRTPAPHIFKKDEYTKEDFSIE